MRLLCLTLTALVGLGVCAGARAEDIRSPDGKLLGTVKREGNREVVRDPNGKAEGYSQKEGNRTVHRDMDGKLRSYTTH